jgi:hypothetical protein
MIPIGEMTDIMRQCGQMKDCPVERMQWVRVNKGIFSGDLGLVENILETRKVLVRLVPRIPDSWLNDQVDIKGVPQTFKSL